MQKPTFIHFVINMWDWSSFKQHFLLNQHKFIIEDLGTREYRGGRRVQNKYKATSSLKKKTTK